MLAGEQRVVQRGSVAFRKDQPAAGVELITQGISPESDPTTGTPQHSASTRTRPNCSTHLAVVRDGSTSTSKPAYAPAMSPWLTAVSISSRTPSPHGVALQLLAQGTVSDQPNGHVVGIGRRVDQHIQPFLRDQSARVADDEARMAGALTGGQAGSGGDHRRVEPRRGAADKGGGARGDRAATNAALASVQRRNTLAGSGSARSMFSSACTPNGTSGREEHGPTGRRPLRWLLLHERHAGRTRAISFAIRAR